MIKTHPLAVVLVTALFLSASLNCWCCVRWFFGTRELQSLEFQFQAINKSTTAVQALANEAIEYSRRNPGIDPLLQQFDLKPKPLPVMPSPALPKPLR